MTTLERRCRLLLRAYPAEYRRDRGDEIIGTLLETTPACRSWPTSRDVRGLVVGGLRARAAFNRRLTTGASLRVAALVGVSAYLAYTAVNYLAFAVLALTWKGRAHQADWSLMLAGALILVAVVLAWVSSRRAVRLTAVTAAATGVSVAGPWHYYGWMFVSVGLACVAAMALFAGNGERPTRRWAWLVAVFGAAPLLEWLLPGAWPTAFFALVEVMGVVSVLWVVIDPRPAIATAVFLLALWLPVGIVSLAGRDLQSAVPLLIVSAVAPVTVWRLHRQSARASAGGGI